MSRRPWDTCPLEASFGRPIGRRGLLRSVLLTAAATLGGELWGRTRPSAEARLAPYRLDSAGRLEPGEATGFAVPGSAVAGILVRLTTGRHVAFDRRCPHLGCPVVWSREKLRLECPCHAAAFDAATGAVLAGPPPHGLRTLEIERRGPELWLKGVA